MKPGIFRIVVKSLIFYRKSVLYQILILAVLSAVISGSLLTGWSVRESIKKGSAEHLGNTGILISAGNRQFDAALSDRLRDSSGINCSGLLEVTGYCQNLMTQKDAGNVSIYAVNSDFFGFHGRQNIVIGRGEAAINTKLADFLGLKKGDEVIIRYRVPADIPADAPFAPSENDSRSSVFRIAEVLDAGSIGNFTLSISQITPRNLFVNLEEFSDNNGKPLKINRLLVSRKDNLPQESVERLLGKWATISDIGLSIVPLPETGGFELRSERIFLDESLTDALGKVLPVSSPVITYLANKIKFGNSLTPYSFVAALPSDLYPSVSPDNRITINEWLADDLSARKGDTITLNWYVPDSLNQLVEKSGRFIVSQIVEMKGIWADSLLMPAFPGISGSESCSEWDAGVPVDITRIRKKDEDYWNRYRGTPKAFISYATGKRLWGSNFGPATAMRFPVELSAAEIEDKLKGSTTPLLLGMHITDIYQESLRAAEDSIDFSTLFISLGFFLILSSLILLSLAIKVYLDSKDRQIRTLYALGFKQASIKKMLYMESVMTALSGSLLGSASGMAVSILFIALLNGVWQGAVQTDTLESFWGLKPLLAGFITSLFFAVALIILTTEKYLKTLFRHKAKANVITRSNISFLFPGLSLSLSLLLFLLSFAYSDSEIILCFASGVLLLLFFMLLWRKLMTNAIDITRPQNRKLSSLSNLYRSSNPSSLVAPLLFISMGIFAVFITGANRMNFDESHQEPSGGTGGFLLWCETAIPVREDLTSAAGKKAFGLDDKEFDGMSIIQMRRSSGNDASCLNLNHIATPPLLGTDPAEFISRGSFSFSTNLKSGKVKNPWDFLDLEERDNIIYGIADQTVLQWGLKIKTGDTLIMRTEDGRRLNIIIAAGLKASVFQGYVLIGMKHFKKYFPSSGGSTLFLADGDPSLTGDYKSLLGERFASHGINIESANSRLKSFYQVTNTYLSVFLSLGAFGLITGVAGLGFVLLRNYNSRKKEFALLMATGFSVRKIRKMIISEQMMILIAGLVTGIIPAALATSPSLKSNTEIPWLLLALMASGILIAGILALGTAVRSVSAQSLVGSLKQE